MEALPQYQILSYTIELLQLEYDPGTKYGHINLWNGIKDAEINPYSYSYPIFVNYPKINLEEKVTSSISNAGKCTYLHVDSEAQFPSLTIKKQLKVDQTTFYNT